MIHRLFRGRWISRLSTLIFIIGIALSCTYFYSRLDAISPTKDQSASSSTGTRHISKLITIVFRDFEDYENDIPDSVQSFASAFPNMKVVVFCGKLVYPPLEFTLSNETLRHVKVVPLDMSLNATLRDLNPFSYITTEFVLIVPDAVRVHRKIIQQLMSAVTKSPDNIIAFGADNINTHCKQVKWNYAEWTLQYINTHNQNVCDSLNGKNALLMKTSLLSTIPDPLGLPFPESLYLKLAVRHHKIHLLRNIKLREGRTVLTHYEAKKESAAHVHKHRLALYEQLGVKRVLRNGGVDWYGCTRTTKRCFPPVRGAPSYVAWGRGAPPCCLRHLRRTLLHALRALAAAGARCWLETNTLLGAVIKGDLLPWADYAEIGINSADVSRVPQLQRDATGPGFLWERATKGSHYRVVFSNTNLLPVLVLPFAARNGSMEPDGWVLAGHKKFPERLLHPLAQISIAGSDVPAPNNARAFLELKLGANAIEQCQKLGAKFFYP